MYLTKLKKKTFYFLCRHLELTTYNIISFSFRQIRNLNCDFEFIRYTRSTWKTKENAERDSRGPSTVCVKWTRKKTRATRRIQYYIERVSEGSYGSSVLRCRNSKCSASIAQTLSKRQMVSFGFGTVICYAFISNTRWLRWYSCS